MPIKTPPRPQTQSPFDDSDDELENRVELTAKKSQTTEEFLVVVKRNSSFVGKDAIFELTYRGDERTAFTIMKVATPSEEAKGKLQNTQVNYELVDLDDNLYHLRVTIKNVKSTDYGLYPIVLQHPGGRENPPRRYVFDFIIETKPKEDQKTEVDIQTSD